MNGAFRSTVDENAAQRGPEGLFECATEVRRVVLAPAGGQLCHRFRLIRGGQCPVARFKVAFAEKAADRHCRIGEQLLKRAD